MNYSSSIISDIRPAKKLLNRKTRRLIFYILMLAIPVAQFLIFYVGVNFNSILLSFKTYSYGFDGEVTGYFWSGFNNFTKVLGDLFGHYKLYELQRSFVNSTMAYLSGLLIGTPLALLFSYYIFKKARGYNLFKIFLFLPSVLSAIVMVTIFSYFSNSVIPCVIGDIFHTNTPGLLDNEKTRMGLLLFYNIWIGFGSGILLYSGAMSGIDKSILEAANIDGANSVSEFFKIIFPLIFPTFITFVTVGLAGYFINQLNLFSFFSSGAEYKDFTFGYYLYNKTVSASLADYPYLAAFGLLITFTLVPITLIVNWALKKFGPGVK